MADPTEVLFLGVEPGDGRIDALEHAGYRCRTESLASSMLDAVRRHRPGVILVSIADTETLEAIRAAKDDTQTRGVAIAAIDIGEDPETLRDCRNAGADDVFEDHMAGPVLVARIRHLLRLSSMEAELVRRSATAGEFGAPVNTEIPLPHMDVDGSMLIVGATEQEIGLLCPETSRGGIRFSVEPDPYRARARVEGNAGESFDGALVYVRDEEMAEKCGYFCRAVRNDRRLYDLPLFMVTEPGAVSDQGAAYGDGANVVAEAPVRGDFVENHLRLLLRGCKRRRELGREIAAALGPKTADEVDSVYSTEFTRAHLGRLSRDKSDRDIVSSAILFFVPTIGEVAAIYGAEEAVILRSQIASWLAALLRVEDMVGRTGADEFLGLMPNTALADAELVRRRVVGVLHQSQFRLTDSMPLGIEVYVQSGITVILPNDSLERVISRASDLLE